MTSPSVLTANSTLLIWVSLGSESDLSALCSRQGAFLFEGGSYGHRDPLRVALSLEPFLEVLDAPEQLASYLDGKDSGRFAAVTLGVKRPG